MLGLKMKKCYLDDVLNGIRMNDVRAYNSPTNGKIALIDSKTSIIYGFVDIVETRFISFYDYVMWHINSSFSKEEALMYYNKNLEKNFCNLFYEYCFRNPIILDKPEKVVCRKIDGSWIEFDETKLVKSYIQMKLF